MSDTGLPPVATEGDLAETSLESVVVQLAGAQVTGVLTVQSEEDIVAVSFEVGEIVGADALNETLEEGLGGALLKEGLLTQAQFSSVLGLERCNNVARMNRSMSPSSTPLTFPISRSVR